MAAVAAHAKCTNFAPIVCISQLKLCVASDCELLYKGRARSPGVTQHAETWKIKESIAHNK